MPVPESLAYGIHAIEGPVGVGKMESEARICVSE